MPWGSKWPPGIGALGPEKGHIVGNTRILQATGRAERVLDATFPHPITGTIYVQASVLPVTVTVDMGSSQGGPRTVDVCERSPVQLPFVGRTCSVMVSGTVNTLVQAAMAVPAMPFRAVGLAQDGSSYAVGMFIDNTAMPGGWGANRTTAACMVGGGVHNSNPGIYLTDGDAALMRLDSAGQVLVTPFAPWALWWNAVRSALVLTAGATSTIVSAPGAGRRLCTVSLSASASAATRVTLESPSATIIGSWWVATGATVPLANLGVPLVGADNGALVIRSSAAATLDITGTGYVQPRA